jgi:RNA polymerase sigma-70 factor (ECF subfamily)
MASLSITTKDQHMPPARDALDPPLRSLLQACQAGDRLAQQQLFQRFYDAFLTICMRYTPDRDSAKELVLQAFLKIFQGLPQLRELEAFPAWAKRITVRSCLDYVRRHSRRQERPLKLADEPVVMSSVLDHFAAEDLLRLVQQLPPRHRAVFSLYTLEGYPHTEIAQQLEITPDNSRWYLSSARKKLQSLLQNLES